MRGEKMLRSKRLLLKNETKHTKSEPAYKQNTSSEHVLHNFAQRVEQNCLILRLHDHEIDVHLLAIEQLDKDALVVLLGDSIRITASRFDEGLKRPVE